MRVLFLGNGAVALRALSLLREWGDPVVGLIHHPLSGGRHVDDLVRVSGLSSDACIDGSTLGCPETIGRIRALGPEIGLSVFFGYILRPPLLALFPRGVVNLHPAYLPFNRGAYPNVWSIVEGTPAGATLHYVDEGVDTGDIIAQEKVPVAPTDTGESLYRKLEDACVSLFIRAWPLLREGRAPRVPQQKDTGTVHRTGDVARIDRIDREKTYRAGELLDILRARTFPPHPGAYFEVNGRRIYVRVSFEEETER